MPTSPVPIADFRLSLALGADDLLDAAHDHMVALALADGTKGVLPTRHSHQGYTFTLSNPVPFGQTQERTAWSERADIAIGSNAPRKPKSAHNRAIEQARTAEVEK